MPRLPIVLLLAVLTPLGLHAQAGAPPQAPASTDATFYAVSYTEVKAGARAAATAALKRYRDASERQDGCLAVELYEQTGRPGHYALVETWRDQKTFDARGAAVAQALTDALEPLRTSAYDQRPYKTLTVGARPAARPQPAVVVIAHVDTAPGPQVPAILTRLAEASRQEPGNLQFDVIQHTMRANHHTVIEMWRSEDALEAHAAATHTRRYRDELQPLTGSPLDERVFQPVR